MFVRTGQSFSQRCGAQESSESQSRSLLQGLDQRVQLCAARLVRSHVLNIGGVWWWYRLAAHDPSLNSRTKDRLYKVVHMARSQKGLHEAAKRNCSFKALLDGAEVAEAGSQVTRPHFGREIHP
jgi:hypothetical protein